MHTSEEIRRNLLSEFGPETYQKSVFNRAYIASIVFNNPEKLQSLNKIVHPVVRKHFEEFVTVAFIILRSPRLFEIAQQIGYPIF